MIECEISVPYRSVLDDRVRDHGVPYHSVVDHSVPDHSAPHHSVRDHSVPMIVCDAAQFDVAHTRSDKAFISA